MQTLSKIQVTEIFLMQDMHFDIICALLLNRRYLLNRNTIFNQSARLFS